ncbi:unnamed protein product [Clonostachys rhizophaga]|uniref:L-ascorbate oxidase n=1 Tax=Clonostachys rhizophaga TaxID=160324 RepID=A0A9N9VRJ1_9HYPO|nr:unnamed protein product [Clonostachys rhizophaga]
MRLGSLFTLLTAALVELSSGTLTTHDETFQPDHILRVSAKNISVACETRYSAVINGTSPGPELRLPAGQVTWIRVYNDMLDANLTMHWHGLAMRMAPFADGSVFASQWPIPPGHFFDYEVSPTQEDGGTYFYHSHVGMEALTAYGPLIVNEYGAYPHYYDEERTLQWGDYFNQTDKKIEHGLEAVPFVWSGETNGVLLNGIGVGLGHTPGTSDNQSTCSFPVINVEPGKIYRFRWIGATALSHLVMQLEDHLDRFTIVQVDGGEFTKPVTVDRMQVGSGQRFDVLFRAKTADELANEGNKTDYFMQFETRERPTVFRSYAVVRYSTKPDWRQSIPEVKAPVKPPFNLTNATYDWLEYKLTPLYEKKDGQGMPTLSEITRRVTLDTWQVGSEKTNQTIWVMNNLTWTMHTFQRPMLVDIYQRGEEAMPNYEAALENNGWDPRVQAFAAMPGEILEIVLQNHGSLWNNGGGVDVHPFHAHGQHYYDIGSGNGTYDAEANERKIQSLGYEAVQRDTTMLHRYTSNAGAGVPSGWRAWRIRVDHPGVWMIHCHTLQHMTMGMQSVWAVGTAQEIIAIPFTESEGYLTYGGSVYGNETYAPKYPHYFDPSQS